ncbi:hypothetical protein VTP01DRAFT_4412 [Rhizomucor pusillus]|uniref:uncharacterized protein n=1 Tax=Rhizomucor pusillus TaxID=4840 RepID=UPI003743BC90
MGNDQSTLKRYSLSRYLPEVRKTRRRLLEYDGLPVTSDANLSERSSGTIGVDLGKIFAAEDKKLKANIDIIEQDLAAGSTIRH